MNLRKLQAQVHISIAAIIFLNNFTFAFSVFGTLDDLTWKCSKGWGSWGRHGILNILSVLALKFSLAPVILWKTTTTLAWIRRITQKLSALNLGSFTRAKNITRARLVWEWLLRWMVDLQSDVVEDVAHSSKHIACVQKTNQEELLST